jgi:hypothetical protein
MEATHRQGRPDSLDAYPLDERRTDNYTFTNMKGLFRYFSNWLDDEDIDAVIEQSKQGFVHRAGCDEEITKLQFIKKCEYALVRILRKGPR